MRALPFRWFFALLVCLPTLAPAADHCLVGVGGDFASGYAGLLARHGIPHEFVLDHQLRDDKFLRRYTAVLLGSVYSSRLPKIAAPLEKYVRAGGRVLWGSQYSLSKLSVRDDVEGEPPLLEWYCAQGPTVRRSAGEAVLASKHNSLARYWSASEKDLVVQNRVSFKFPNAEVLCKYASVSVMDRDRNQNRPEVRSGDPALVRVPRGKGYYVMSGAAFGVGLGLYGVHADRLVLGLVAMMTDGRGVPQLVDEGVRLGRHEVAQARPAATTDVAADLFGAEETEPKRPAAPGGREALPAPLQSLLEEPEPEFALYGVYLPPQGGGRVVLNYANPQHFYSVDFTPERVTLSAVRGGGTKVLGQAAGPGQTARMSFVIKERRDKLTVFLPAAGRLQVQSDDLWEGLAGHSSGAFADQWRVQPLAPIYFTDDFMRTNENSGEWETVKGSWSVESTDQPESSANPFTYAATSTGESLCVAGHGFWDDYWLQTAVRPDDSGGAVGLVTYRVGEGNFWLFRARVNDQPTAYRNGFELIRVLNGQPAVVAKAPGALVKGQWTRLSVRMIDKWIGAFVDGQRVLVTEDTHLSGGKIGLWTQGVRATFDDVRAVSAYGREELPEVFRGLMPGYAGVIDQDTWAGPASEWRADPDRAGVFWNRGVFFGNAGIRRRAEVLQQPNAAASIMFMPTRALSAGGYGLTARRAGNQVQCRLVGPNGARDAQAAWPTDGVPTLSLALDGDQMVATIDGKPVLALPHAGVPTGGWKLGFATAGAAPRLSDLAYWSENTWNDTFQGAPTKWWIGSGTWESTSRWSCQPQWSWYGGVSPVRNGKYSGPAAIWSKSAFEGDQRLEFYTGPKMIPKPGNDGTLEQVRDFNVTLCGDGKDVRSGYAFLVGPAGADRVQLLRQGEPVADTRDFYLPRETHNRWIHLTASRTGNEVSLEFDGQRVLSWTDPAPLPGGYAALWTDANGILVPRVTLHYAKQLDRPLSLALAPPPAEERGADVGLVQSFDTGVEGWFSIDDQAVPTQDTTISQSPPASLVYKTDPRPGAFPVLLSPQLHVAGSTRVKLSVRCSRANEIVFTLMEEDQSRYLYQLQVKPNQWRQLDLRLTDFTLSPDSSDENGQLDANEIQYLTLTDMDAVRVFQGRQEDAPERSVWLDEIEFY